MLYFHAMKSTPNNAAGGRRAFQDLALITQTEIVTDAMESRPFQRFE